MCFCFQLCYILIGLLFHCIQVLLICSLCSPHFATCLGIVLYSFDSVVHCCEFHVHVMLYLVTLMFELCLFASYFLVGSSFLGPVQVEQTQGCRISFELTKPNQSNQALLGL